MINLIAKLFIKDSTDKNYIRKVYGIVCSVYGILINLGLFLGKYIAGIISGSIAVMADAINNLSDAGSSFVTLIGFKLAGKKADEKHPYGHGRIEYLSAMVVSCFILIMGFELLKTSVGRIIRPSQLEKSTITVVFLIIAIIVKIYMFMYNKAIGTKIASKAMAATAMDSLSDAIATFSVLVSMFFCMVLGINIDGYSGLLVAVFILYTGITAFLDTINPLLGKAPDLELVSCIEEIVSSYDEILGIHDLMVHDYGPGRVYATLHGEVDGSKDIFMLHDVIDRIEKRLSKELNIEAVIHMDPMTVNDKLIDEHKAYVTDVVKALDTSFSIHDFRMVDTETEHRMMFDILTSFDSKITDEKIVNTVTQDIKKHWPDYDIIIKIDKG